jgi:hypothetical protein
MEENENVEETTNVVEETQFESAEDPSVIKVDLSKPPTQNETPEQEITDGAADNAGVVGSDENAEPVQEQEEVQPQVEAQEQPVETPEPQQNIAEEVKEEPIAGETLPEGVQNLVSFIQETGGTVEDYVALNRDYSKVDNQTLLNEYYKATKPHLDGEERSFLMNETFGYDEEIDDEKEIRRKKIAMKEQIAQARAYLDGQKSKYYEEIKARTNLTEDQRNAVDFYDQYQKESEANQRRLEEKSKLFQNRTMKFFGDKFEGFEYEVGDQKLRYNVNNVDQVRETQSDLNNFVGKFLDENGNLSDADGYHKSLYTAMNADAIAKHFYEQGKADAIKTTVAESKNVDMKPRQSMGSEVTVGGVKYKVLGDNANDFKVRIKKGRN